MGYRARETEGQKAEDRTEGKECRTRRLEGKGNRGRGEQRERGTAGKGNRGRGEQRERGTEREGNSGKGEQRERGTEGEGNRGRGEQRERGTEGEGNSGRGEQRERGKEERETEGQRCSPAVHTHLHPPTEASPSVRADILQVHCSRHHLHLLQRELGALQHVWDKVDLGQESREK